MSIRNTKTVYVVGGGAEFDRMFVHQGWRITNDLISANLVQFTGGSDVSPSFYGEGPHPKTHSNLIRDKRERIIFNIALKNNIPMAGICRGGQFLNVMNGGRMWQDVNNHTNVGIHKCVDTDSGEAFQATSTHHQLMNPHKSGRILAIAKEATRKERIGRAGQVITLMGSQGQDVEVLFYLKSKSLCFQPHPEFGGNDDLKDRYFNYIAQNLHLS